MVTVRDTQRRYREEAGKGYLTRSFHCWDCATMCEGDSWHCPLHQVDFCVNCRGHFGRAYAPYFFYEHAYIYE